MVFPNDKYILDAISEEQEKLILQYAESRVIYMIEKQKIQKSKNKSVTQKAGETFRIMNKYKDKISNIDITENEMNLYMLNVASKLKRIDILYENNDEMREIDKCYREISDLNKNNILNKGNLLKQKHKELEHKLYSISQRYVVEDTGKFIKKIFPTGRYIREQAIKETIQEYKKERINYWLAERKGEKPIFSKIYTINVLEKVASMCKNLNAKVDIIDHNKEKIVAEINGTICVLEIKNNNIMQFFCMEDKDNIWSFNGKWKELGRKRLLECYSMFVNNIYAKNIKAEYEYSSNDKKRIIGKEDVLVKSNIKYCFNKHHKVIDVIAKVPVEIDKDVVVWDYLHAAYCSECNKYYILDEDYKKLQGKPLCKVTEIINGKERIINYTPMRKKYDSESIIHSYGYNVNVNDGLSEYERQKILIDLIRSNYVSQEEVLSYLDALIMRGSGVSRYENAVKKWKADRAYIENMWFTDNEFTVKSIFREIDVKI